MNQYQTLRITRAPESNASEAGDRYWLRIVQPSKENGAEDAITTGEAAELADTLYDIDPCLEPDEQLEAIAEITEEKLYQSAADVFGGDLDACRAALSGDYVEQIKIIRSHPDEEPPEPYQLELSAGRVAATGQRWEVVTALLSINGQSSIDLDYPVVVNKNTPVEQQGVTFSWIGDVIGADGLINPPKIERSGNTIYWDGEATGQVKAKYPTVYDVATVEVPGKPSVVVGVGDAQDVKVLAYWHMMVFPGDITAPVTDDSVSKGALQQLCGYMVDSPAYVTQPTGGTGGTSNSDADTDPDPEPDESEDDSIYGCQTNDHYPYDSPAYYKKVCCKDMPPGIATCPESRARRPGGKSLPDDVIKAYQAQGNVEFIPCSPEEKEGCGSIIMRMWVPQRNCCEDIAPLEWDYENSIEVLSPSSSGRVYVNGGVNPRVCKVAGQGFWLDSGFTKKSAVMVGNNFDVYTNSEACGNCKITVTDDCSMVVEYIRATVGRWVTRPDLDGVATLSGVGDTFSAQTAEKTHGRFLLRETRSYVSSDHMTLEECSEHCHTVTLPPNAIDTIAAITGREPHWDDFSYCGPAWYENCACYYTVTRETREWVC